VIRFDIEEVRSRVSVEQIAGRDVSWDMRKSIPSRGDYWACCPFHSEATPSFHVIEPVVGEGRFYCFGCGVGGSVFDYVMERDGCSFREALELVAKAGGIAPGSNDVPRLSDADRKALEDEGGAAYFRRIDKDSRVYSSDRIRRSAWRKGWLRAQEADRVKRFIRTGIEIWVDADPDDPLIATYIAARIGIERQQALWHLFEGPPPTLRLAPDLPYRDLKTGKVIERAPALVGLVTRDGLIAGIHRTWLEKDGSWRRRDLSKRMLGDTYAGAITFGPPADSMIVGEGIESTLAELGRLALAGHALDVTNPSAKTGWTAHCALTRGAMVGRGDPRFADRGANSPSPVPDWQGAGWAAPLQCSELILLGDGDSKNPATARGNLARGQRRHSVRSDGRPRSCLVDWAGGDPALGLDHADIALRPHV